MFSYKAKDYLILMDYYSNFGEIDLLPNTESNTVVRKLKAQYARYGIPDILMSDNGPQYTAIVNHRNTPTESGYSPAQCLMSRRTKTLLPTTSNLLKPEVVMDDTAL